MSSEGRMKPVAEAEIETAARYESVVGLGPAFVFV